MPSLRSKSPTQDDILRTLETLRNDKEQRRAYFQPQNYTNFMPDTLGFQQFDLAPWKQNLRSIDQSGKDATALSLTIAQNKAAQEAQKQAAQKKEFARKNLIATAQAQATNNAAAQQSAASATSSAGGHYNAITGKWETPPVAPAKGFNINAGLTTQNWHGFSLTMNRSVIGRFTGFLNALSAQGYKIKSIGTYANRNIAGTSIKSLHARGLAMDINPSDNPVSYNGHNITNLPPGVGALAARYGIKWGGAWLHSKRDPMHFSVPYGGTM